MAPKICMNVFCGATASIEWIKGWNLRSGGFANLCDKCGFAYEKLVFCDTFHLKESGWRECSSCGKRLHCGCIASKSVLELLDNGGVECISCAKTSELSSIRSDKNPFGFGTLTENVGKPRPGSMDNKMDGDCVDQRKLMQLGRSMEGNGPNCLLQSQKKDTDESRDQIKREKVMPPIGEVGSTSFSNLNQASVGSPQIVKRDTMGVKDMYNTLSQTCLSITLGLPSGTNLAQSVPGVVVEGREQSKTPSSFQQGQRSRHLLPKTLKTSPTTGLETNKDMLPQVRVARPPAEGRGRNQLLPRYWPRITDQELQQISGDSNSTIVPLFEKVLSASDAGRIGRLVLPKACAEAYFPPISQPEGLPLKIQDAKGKDWVFQFRFWPNNNSRMYVLEGVTPCIQSMQLQAGDTVTFSRMDPEGKLVMGFRKASKSVPVQDSQISALANGALANETFFSGVIDNLPIISGYSGLLQSLKGSSGPHLNLLSEHLNSSDGDISWCKSEKHGSRTNESLPLQSMLVPEKKRTRNIGSKSKRLLIDSEDALQLKLTWEEAQDLLRPPPSIKPSIVVIEDHEFEEYEEPPVFGKRTIFTARPSGGQDQWAQCDSCSKWRRLPVEALLPPKWTCAENSWDLSRCLCSAPNEMSLKELENLLGQSLDYKKRRIEPSHKPAQEREPSGLDALATAAVLGDSGGDLGMPSVATTTKHPRHRPGCTCIVCIQPPSGKGPKHKPTCTCNVCMTVKRRFKTLMMRKKKRQSEREAEISQRKQHIWGPKEDAADRASRGTSLHLDPSEHEARQVNESEYGGAQSKILMESAAETSKAHIDLNCHPDREEDLQVGSTRMSMMSLLQVASLPLEKYLKKNGLTSLICEQQASSSSHVQPQATVENEEQLPDEAYAAVVIGEQESKGDKGYCEPDPDTSNPV